ncbi:MAG: FAD:protein FMN transferase [Streptococcaceae bacterium]|jgi:thiamine biosynthesis lipoprotein|nr:FAD:protein FMN transferase [Streptococcaceae bacterium]
MKKIALLLLFASLILAGCQDKKAEVPASKKEFYTGTYAELTFYGKDKKVAIDEAYKTINKLVTQIETNEQGESEIDKVNKNAGKTPVKVSANVYDLVERSIKTAEETNGEFDPAIGGATSLWHIGFADAGKPSETDLEKIKKLLDYKKIKMDKAKSTIFLEEKGMKIDLGGVGKGWLAQSVMEGLKKKEITRGIINFGGHVFTYNGKGQTSTPSWSIKMGDPSLVKSDTTEALAPIATVESTSSSFVMTSMYARYLLVGNKVYSHLIDQKTARPYDNDLTAVYVMGEDPVQVDLLSNALYGMGCVKGLEYVNAHKEIDAVFALENKELHVSKGFKGKIVLEKGSEFKLVNE